MTNALIIFALQFACVCALGLQSLNVNGGHYLLAVATSIIISLASLYSINLTLVINSMTLINVIAFCVGSALGIVCSMRLHPNLVRLITRRPDPPGALERGIERYSESVNTRLFPLKDAPQKSYLTGNGIDLEQPK